MMTNHSLLLRLVLFAALGCGGAGSPNDGGMSSGPRALGSVIVGGAVQCATKTGVPLPNGTTCQMLSVSCPEVAPIQAIVAVTQPSVSPKGTVIALEGGGG